MIVLTAKGQADDRRTAEVLGASAFITKPFSNREVVDCCQPARGELRPVEDGRRGPRGRGTPPSLLPILVAVLLVPPVVLIFASPPRPGACR